VSLLDRYVRTRGFSLGLPRLFTISPDGQRVVFIRGHAGDDAAGSLWEHDVTTGAERVVVDAATLPQRIVALADDERARRERMRITTTGITEYATDAAVTRAVFTAAGRLFLVVLATGEVTALGTPGPVVDPRLSPDGRLAAYVSGGALRLIGADGAGDRSLLAPDGPDITYGLAEHVASESMGRYRGFWWSPDSDRLLVARVDNSPLATWYLSDPTDPTATPTAIRYPPAGTANALVTLHIVYIGDAVAAVDGQGPDVRWDTAAFEYLTAAGWDEAGPLIAVQNRAQTVLRVLAVDPLSGETAVVAENTDPAWTTLVTGIPARTASGQLVWSADRDGTRHLLVDGVAVTPAGLNVHEVLAVDGNTVLFSATDEPTMRPLWTYSRPTGLARLTAADGVYSGARAGGTTVILRQALDSPVTVTVQPVHGAARTVASRAEEPEPRPRVELVRAGERALRTAVLYPTEHTPGSGPLPVLLDPYGGPAAQRVLAARGMYLLSQWFADQGFVVVIIDGRGTPGRGPAWERTVHLNRSDAALDDQVDGLHAVAATHPDLDLTRVGIRGWSFGGYLAAVAVLRRPDVFHAAVAGAPPTDQRLYDTHWQERFLGHPDDHPEAYDHSSLLDDAPSLRRPLMLIHGLRDDNVHAAHTLRLSAALLAAGRPHTVLPLGQASHMVHSPDTQAQLIRLQAEFLLRELNQPR
jgi:dipeptidyl-peptidase-4